MICVRPVAAVFESPIFVTAFGKLVRTTAFRLTLAYLFIFGLFAASLLGYFEIGRAHV